MDSNDTINDVKKELDLIENKIESLSQKYHMLLEENKLLKTRQEKEASEKYKIQQKNQKVQKLTQSSKIRL